MKNFRSLISSLLCMLVAISSCTPAAYRGESVIDRTEEACEARGGTWTNIGCVFTLPFEQGQPAPSGTLAFDCAQLQGTMDTWGQCSVSVMEDL